LGGAYPSFSWYRSCSAKQPEVFVNKRTFGFVAGVVGSALGAWWWARQRRPQTYSASTTSRDSGTAIFDNALVPSDIDAII
jgi:hypothetical protein